MPFKSKAQQRYLYATEPKVAKKFSKEMSKEDWKDLPEKVRPKKGKRMGAMLDALKRMGK
jgi:hypothetical protein